jgi:hypothetical protein
MLLSFLSRLLPLSIARSTLPEITDPGIIFVAAVRHDCCTPTRRR